MQGKVQGADGTQPPELPEDEGTRVAAQRQDHGPLRPTKSPGLPPLRTEGRTVAAAVSKSNEQTPLAKSVTPRVLTGPLPGGIRLVRLEGPAAGRDFLLPPLGFDAPCPPTADLAALCAGQIGGTEGNALMADLVLADEFVSLFLSSFCFISDRLRPIPTYAL